MSKFPDLEIEYEGHGLYCLYAGPNKVGVPRPWEECVAEYEERYGI